MWKCKHYMKVGRVNHFCPAFVYPEFFVYSLTVRAVTVTAGIIVKFRMAAIGTLADIIPESTGFTVHDGM